MFAKPFAMEMPTRIMEIARSSAACSIWGNGIMRRYASGVDGHACEEEEKEPYYILPLCSFRSYSKLVRKE